MLTGIEALHSLEVIHFCCHQSHKMDVWCSHLASNKADTAQPDPDQHCADPVAADSLKTTAPFAYIHSIFTGHWASQIPSYFLWKAVWKMVTLPSSFEQTDLVHFSTQLGPCLCWLFPHIPSVTTVHAKTQPVPAPCTSCLYFPSLLHSLVSGWQSLENHKIFLPSITW